MKHDTDDKNSILIRNVRTPSGLYNRLHSEHQQQLIFQQPSTQLGVYTSKRNKATFVVSSDNGENPTDRRTRSVFGCILEKPLTAELNSG